MTNKKDTAGHDGFERALASLTPQSTLDRDRLMFRAGQRAASSRNRLWQLTTLAIASVAVVLSVVLWNQAAPRTVERVVYVPANDRKTTAQVTNSVVGGGKEDMSLRREMARYLELRRRLLVEGIEALPSWEPADFTDESLGAGAYAVPRLRGEPGRGSIWWSGAFGERSQNDET